LGSPLPNENPGEIKVREIEAYASVADLIHAAIVANSGAASLKEVRSFSKYFYPLTSIFCCNNTSLSLPFHFDIFHL
jgi:hypothetical protein